MSDCFTDKVFSFTQEKALFSAPCHVVVGVSGGADSMALLHLLLRWPVEGLRVSVVHVHHGLREDTADRDEKFVRAFCEENSVPLTVIHEDVASVAAKEHLTTEEAGRRVRYAHFESVRRRVGADYVLTAHTAGDQAETLLMHMIRGCGLDGLAGIPPMRGFIRRPLLCCTRGEIEAYCAAYGVPYMDDETNTDVRYTRNFIRHRILPLMRELNPSVDRALLRLQEHTQADAAYIRDVAQTALDAARRGDGYDRTAFVRQPSVIRRCMIRLLFGSVAAPDFEEIHVVAAEQAVLREKASVSLPDGLVFSVAQESVFLFYPAEMLAPDEQEISVFPEEIFFGNKKLVFERIDVAATDSLNVHNLLLHCAVDCDKINGKLYLRCRMEGDYMHPSGRGVGKSLKKWMNEWHMPAHLRDVFPILCDDDGIVMVPGYASDERVRVTESTKHYLVCKVLEV